VRLLEQRGSFYLSLFSGSNTAPRKDKIKSCGSGMEAKRPERSLPSFLYRCEHKRKCRWCTDICGTLKNCRIGTNSGVLQVKKLWPGHTNTCLRMHADRYLHGHAVKEENIYFFFSAVDVDGKPRNMLNNET